MGRHHRTLTLIFMAALNFPSSPSTGQIYTANGISFIWNGTSWNAFSGLFNNLALIEAGTVTVAAASIDIQNIPAVYKHLKLVVSLRTTESAIYSLILLRCNNDSTAGNYIGQKHLTQKAANVSQENNGATATIVPDMYTSGGTASASLFGLYEVMLVDYVSTLKYKTAKSQGGWFQAAATTDNYLTQMSVGTWKNTAALNRITLVSTSGNLEVGSSWSLYGLA